MSLNGKVIVGDPLIGNYPAEIDATDDGASVDFDGYGSLVVAIQTIGGVGGTNPELDGKIQESPDGGSWFDVEGATFTRVVASNKSQAIVFNRTMRYLRHNRVVAGISPTFVLTVSFIPLDPTECIYTNGERCVYGNTRRVLV